MKILQYLLFAKEYGWNITSLEYGRIFGTYGDYNTIEIIQFTVIKMIGEYMADIFFTYSGGEHYGENVVTYSEWWTVRWKYYVI